MTAEERMAYFQGEKKRSPAFSEQNKGKNYDKIILKIRFTIAVVLFIIFLSLDYTGYEIRGITSHDIVEEVTKDFKLPEQLNL